MTDTKRNFLGIPIEGDQYHAHYQKTYTPRPIEELYPYIKEAFDNGIEALTWEQYTPYFNDGETCEFNVYDLSVTSNKDTAANWLDENFYEEKIVEVSEEEYKRETEGVGYYIGYVEEDGKFYHKYQDGTYDYIPGVGHPDGIREVRIPIGNIEFEDALRTTFGDHTQVVVTPDRVIQFEYSHD